MRAGVGDLLHDGKQVKGGTRQAVYACHRHHVAGGKLLEHPQKFFPVGADAGHLLAEYPDAAGRLQLPELGIEGLAIGADAGIADQAGKGLCGKCRYCVCCICGVGWYVMADR